MARAEKKARTSLEKIGTDTLGPEQEGTVISHYGAALDVEDLQGNVYRCSARQNIGDLVCGDQVIWQPAHDQSGVIVALKPRKSLLARPDFYRQLKPVAANIDQILVVVAPQPELSTDLIDRYLVAAEIIHIPPVIVVNKIDLLDQTELELLKQQLEEFKIVGYQIIYTSTKQSHGLDSLVAQLNEKTSIFVGHSGVGKSSLIKTLLPSEAIKIGELSEATGKGKHTTSVTRLYHLQEGGDLIDSPGVRDFGLWNISPDQLAFGFVEFRQYIGQCKFADCRHKVEPGCAIQAALKEKKITQRRLDSFHRILSSLHTDEMNHNV